MQTDSDALARMRRALALAQAALDLPEDERESPLQLGCAGDAALAAEVAALLRAEAQPQHALERLRMGIDAEDPGVDPIPGSRIGRYLVAERIGSGGMGTVYRAEPVDGVARQPVALKLIKRGMDSEDIMARFLAERDILARLEHPNIARLLDGGVTVDGRPWFALELVSGAPLLPWCDARRLDLDRRIGMFLSICDAVAYAHRNLIVHRDIKPGNVLVTEAGVVKLLDFGIAKVVDGESHVVTRSIAPMMTPEYAAPEQFARGQVTTQTDVYQLGLLLYELLGGQRAAKAADTQSEPPRLDAGFAATQRLASQQQEIARARMSSVPALLRALRGDLDRIVRRALHPAPERRFASVAALADDLRRYLRNEPVTAGDDSVAYRLRKFVSRHRVAVFAGIAVLASLATGLALSLRETEQLRRTERQLESALGVVEDVFLAADPYAAKGGETRAQDLLENARLRIVREMSGQPAIAARLLAEIGDVYVSLDDREHAELALHDTLDAARRAELPAYAAQAQARLAHYAVVLDGDKSRAHEIDDAIAALRAAGPSQRRALAAALRIKADYLFNSTQYTEIPALIDEFVRLTGAVSGEQSSEFAMALANQASLLRGIGRNKDAMAPAQHAYALIRSLGSTAPEAAVLYIEQQYAGALAYNDRAAEAEPILRSALKRAQALHGADSWIAMGLSWEVAASDTVLGQFASARALLGDLLTHMNPTPSANLAGIHNALGLAQLGEGDAAAAAQSFAIATTMICADAADSQPCIATRLNQIDALLAQRQAATVRPLLDAIPQSTRKANERVAQRWEYLEARWQLQSGDATGAVRTLDVLIQGLPADARLLTQEQAALLSDAGDARAAVGDLTQARRHWHLAEQAMARLWQGEPFALRTLRAHLTTLDAAHPGRSASP